MNKINEYLIFLNEGTEVGKHNEVPDDEFDKNELKKGIKIEQEHSDNPKICKAIAKDHLSEFPDYYTRLEKMEKEAAKKWKKSKDEDEEKED